MIKGSVALAATALARYPLSSFGFPEPEAGATLIPFLDQQPVSKDPMLRWEQLKSWITPSDQFFHVQHYGVPDFDVDQWRLEISGLVRSPKTLTLAELKSRRRKSVIATLECSGNSSSSGFAGAIGNVQWTGTPLAPLLRECGLLERGAEVVFFGNDEKIEKIRDKETSPAACLAMTPSATTCCSPTK